LAKVTYAIVSGMSPGVLASGAAVTRVVGADPEVVGGELDGGGWPVVLDGELEHELRTRASAPDATVTAKRLRR
jgi:hypothetical protein